MKVVIPFEDCFRADEIVRIGRALKYSTLREKHRKALLEDIDRTLPDYDRPLKKMPRKWKGVSLRKIIMGLLP